VNGNSQSELLGRLQALTGDQRSDLTRRLLEKKTSGHALVAEALCRCGVKRVLGVAGTTVDRSFPECAARGIRPIGTRHQHAAVLAAAAANYVAGRLESVVVVSAGPAVTNVVVDPAATHPGFW
jgi:hypothetical protein